MRDYVLLIALLALLPVSLLRPYFGIYAWYWVSVMNPHRLTWGIAYRFPIAMMVAGATLAGALMKPKSLSRLAHREVFMIVTLAVLFTVNSAVAMFPELVWSKWEQVMKVLLMTLATVWLIDTRERLRMVLLVVTCSVAFFPVKAIPWIIVTGGQYRIEGPPQTSIGSNNSIAMALNMLVPLMYFFATHEQNRWIKRGSWVMFVASIAGIVVSYSRGAFLGALAVFFLLFLRSKQKLLALTGLVVIVGLVLAFVPGAWFERMNTIRTYQEDQSAQERLQTWGFALELANQRPFTGGGFQAFRANPTNFDGHSNYFGLVAEQGYIALGVYLLLMVSTLATLASIRRRVRRFPSLAWYGDLAAMLQISIVAYAVNGLTLNHQYLDIFYFLVAAAVVAKRCATAEIARLLSPAVAAPVLTVPSAEGRVRESPA